MTIKHTSFFKSPKKDHAWLNQWANQLEKSNERNYKRIELETVLGKTHVWGLNMDISSAETLVIFPGARTTTQKPYYMDTQLAEVNVDTYLLEGDKDLLFPFQKSIDNARKHIRSLKDVHVFENVGHGIETYKEAMQYLGDIIKRYKTIL